MICERLKALRAEMKNSGIDVYIVPTSDYHDSEYVGDYFKERKFITGFTGSAGTAVITMQEAGLWTDGRYFLQAEDQLKDTGVTLYKSGEEGVPTIEAFLKEKLAEKQCLGFDGRTVSCTQGKIYEKIAAEKNGTVRCNLDLIDRIWQDRPGLSKGKVTVLSKELTGLDTQEKFSAVREKMEELHADVHILTSLCDIAWLLNVRGQDVKHVPVVLSYLALTGTECLWFVQDEILTPEIKAYLKENRITVKSYDSVYEYAAGLRNTAVLLDCGGANYRICTAMDSSVRIINQKNPTYAMKAVKNETELSHIRKAHVKDAVAMCKFMYWLKMNVGKIPMTEISVSDYLEKLCRSEETCRDLSFDTICGYNEHGAIIHYSASKETDAEIRPEGLLLVDSGRQYDSATTDITRTFALGPITDEMRSFFTRIARANLNLAAQQFVYGCNGMNLDIIARQPLWEIGLDYKHGTGHGIGCMLSVHEGPNSIRWRQTPGRSENTVLEEGMITSDEPGIYLEGKFGIRTESELLCRKGEKNEYGQFMYFETITYVPIDLDAIDPEQMTAREKKLLNDYHAEVYGIVSPYLTTEEAEWLKKYTRAI